MYQLRRFLIRGLVSQPHMVGGIIIGYFTLGILSYYSGDLQFNYVRKFLYSRVNIINHILMFMVNKSDNIMKLHS